MHDWKIKHYGWECSRCGMNGGNGTAPMTAYGNPCRADTEGALTLDEKEVERLRAALREAERALEWYADEDNHRNRGVYMGGGGDAAPILGDRGRRARDALSAIRGARGPEREGERSDG